MRLKLIVSIITCVLAVSCAENAKQSNAVNAAKDKIADANQKPTTSQTENILNPAEAVKVSVEKLEVKANSSSQIKITLNVVAPFHINANPPSEKNLIATKLDSVNASKGFAFEKAIYPKGEPKKLTYSENPISIYVGETVIKLPFKVGESADRGENKMNAKLTFQPCTDEVCYRPQTMDIELPITVK